MSKYRQNNFPAAPATKRVSETFSCLWYQFWGAEVTLRYFTLSQLYTDLAWPSQVCSLCPRSPRSLVTAPLVVDVGWAGSMGGRDQEAGATNRVGNPQVPVGSMGPRIVALLDLQSNKIHYEIRNSEEQFNNWLFYELKCYLWQFWILSNVLYFI
jgi:hypothetical protein